MCFQQVNVWFVCKVCRSSFQKIPEFLEHKKEKHFDEFQNIKCVIFEESSINKDSVAENPVVPVTNAEILNFYSVILKHPLNAELDQEPIWQKNIQSTLETERDSDVIQLTYTSDDFDFNSKQQTRTEIVSTVDVIETETEDADTEEIQDPPLVSISNLNLTTKASDTKNTSNNTKEVECASVTPSTPSKLNPYVSVKRLNEISPRPPLSPNTEPEPGPATVPTPALEIVQEQPPPLTLSTDTDDFPMTLKDWVIKQRSLSTKPEPQDLDTEANPELKLEADHEDNFNLILLHPDPATVDIGLITSANPIYCKLCCKKLDCEPVVKNHVLHCWRHNKKKHRYCLLCDRTFRDLCRFQRHEQYCDGAGNGNGNSQTNKEIRFKCLVCPVEFETEAQLKFHADVHKSKAEQYRPYVCEICGLTFRLEEGLNSHINIHSDDRPFKCPYPSCPHAFKSKQGLAIHKKYHSADRPFKCPYKNPGANPGDDCVKSFKSKYELTVHIRGHTGERPFKCSAPSCAKGFVRSADLAYHIKAHHCGDESESRRFKCGQCAKAFVTSSSLKLHELVHREEKPFHCTSPGCALSFKRKAGLARHALLHNAGGKVHQCDMCGKTFTRAATLTKHLLVHNII